VHNSSVLAQEAIMFGENAVQNVKNCVVKWTIRSSDCISFPRRQQPALVVQGKPPIAQLPKVVCEMVHQAFDIHDSRASIPRLVAQRSHGEVSVVQIELSVKFVVAQSQSSHSWIIW
jgi:hypothetical protein